MKLIGNEPLKKLINQMKHDQPLPHILLHGISGTGKSTIARWIAEECNTEYVLFYAANMDEFFLNFTLQNITPNFILIIDEIHGLSRKVMEMLYQPMEEFVINGVDIPKFTLIAATTELYKIPDPLYRRFILPYKVELYCDEEIQEFITLYSEKEISDDLAEMVSKLCKGNPGIARNYMEIIRRLSNGPEITDQDVLELMEIKKIDTSGLDVADWIYLESVRSYDTIGLQSLSSLTGESIQTVEQKIEPYLMQMKLVIKTGKGRRLTPQGSRYMKGRS